MVGNNTWVVQWEDKQVPGFGAALSTRWATLLNYEPGSKKYLMGDYRISCLIYLLVCLLAYLFILLFRLFEIGILYVTVLAVLEELFIFKAQALKKISIDTGVAPQTQ